MKTIIELLNRIRGLSFVIRWNFHPYIKGQNVAEHSYYVVLYAMMLLDIEIKLGGVSANASTRADILQYALFHDVAESVTSDIPKLVKDRIGWRARNIEDEALDEVFNADIPHLAWIVQQWQLIAMGDPNRINDMGKKIVKAADLLDILIYAKQEERLGNTNFGEIYGETVFALRKLKLRSVDYILDQNNEGQGTGETSRFSHL